MYRQNDSYTTAIQQDDTNTHVDEAFLGCVLGNCAQQVPNGETLYWLVYSNLDSQQHQSVQLPFFGHGIAFRKNQQDTIAIFEKRGKGACEVNLREGKLTRMITTLPEREFYGHGCYLKKEGLLLAAETVVGQKHEGLMVIRDQDTLKELDSFPTFGSRPHDVHLIDDGNTLMVTNGGGLYGEKECGSVVLIDLASRSLIEKYEVAQPAINAGHVARAQNGNFITVSAPRDGITQKNAVGGISIGGQTRPFVRAAASSLLSKRLKGETLSVCVNDSRGYALTTTPDANLLIVWDVESGALIKKIPMEMPKGVCISSDQNYAIVSNIKNGPGLDFINLDSLEIVETMRTPVPYTGSHLFTQSVLF